MVAPAGPVPRAGAGWGWRRHGSSPGTASCLLLAYLPAGAELAGSSICFATPWAYPARTGHHGHPGDMQPWWWDTDGSEPPSLWLCHGEIHVSISYPFPSMVLLMDLGIGYGINGLSSSGTALGLQHGSRRALRGLLQGFWKESHKFTPCFSATRAAAGGRGEVCPSLLHITLGLEGREAAVWPRPT